MKKQLLSLALCLFVCFNIFAQSSAESSSNVTFERSSTSKISYNGFAVEYVIPSYKAAYNAEAYTSKGIALNYEAYSPLSEKLALSANISAVLLDEVNNLELNLGLYYLLYKGFYVKPQVGIGQYSFSDPEIKDFISTWNFTYRGQVGYLFKLNSATGKRDKFIDLGLAYHNIGNSDLKIKYFGIAAKFLWGPKPSN